MLLIKDGGEKVNWEVTGEVWGKAIGFRMDLGGMSGNTRKTSNTGT